MKKEKCTLSLLSLWKYTAIDTYIWAVHVHIKVSNHSLWNRYSFSKSSWNYWKKPNLLSQGCRIPQVLPLGQVLFHSSYRAGNLPSFPTIMPRPEERDGSILPISLEKNHRKCPFRPFLMLSAGYWDWWKHPWKLEGEVQHQFQYKTKEVNNGNHSSCLSWKELPFTGR